MRKFGILTAAAAFATVIGFAGPASAQLTFPPDADRSGYWHFDSAAAPSTADALDGSGNGNDGTFEGDAVRGDSTPAPLDPGQDVAYIDLDGTGDFVDAIEADGPDSALDQAGSFTVMAWVALASNGTLNTVLSKDTSAGVAETNFNLHVANNHVAMFVSFTDAATVAADGGPGTEACDGTPGCFVEGEDDFEDGSHVLGTWRHIAGVYEQTSAGTGVLRVYLDGVLTGQSNVSGTDVTPRTNDSSVRVGNRKFAGDTGDVDGMIDEARIYDRALTAREILQLASGISIEKELVDSQNLDDPFDTTVDQNEDWQFVMKITVTNNSDTTLDDLLLIDGLPGDLELGDDTSALKGGGAPCPDTELDETTGTATATPTGNSAKCHVTWDIGSLDSGDSAMLTMNTSTDTNPRGLRKPGKDGQSFQEYTGPGPYCINQGGTLIDSDEEIVLGHSNGLEVAEGTAVDSPIAINNAGFEDAAPADGDADAPGVPQWLGNIGTGTLNPSSATHFTAEAPEGVNVAFVAADLAAGGFLAQILSDTLTAGKTYTLEVDVGDSKNAAFPGYEVALVAGLAFPPNILDSQDENDVPVGDDAFETVTVQFHADAGDADLGDPLVILLLSDDIVTFFDDVRLTASMPAVSVVEPEDCGS